mmetsp:Transcript_2467/g.4193  ORF Transcript_2467/g.4193 Transcript_2467/m.4193 type:complete len:235 (-) Transcript_2467:991-1695(-)
MLMLMGKPSKLVTPKGNEGGRVRFWICSWATAMGTKRMAKKMTATTTTRAAAASWTAFRTAMPWASTVPRRTSSSAREASASTSSPPSRPAIRRTSWRRSRPRRATNRPASPNRSTGPARPPLRTGEWNRPGPSTGGGRWSRPGRSGATRCSAPACGGRSGPAPTTATPATLPLCEWCTTRRRPKPGRAPASGRSLRAWPCGRTCAGWNSRQISAPPTSMPIGWSRGAWRARLH